MTWQWGVVAAAVVLYGWGAFENRDRIAELLAAAGRNRRRVITWSAVILCWAVLAWRNPEATLVITALAAIVTWPASRRFWKPPAAEVLPTDAQLGESTRSLLKP